MMMKCLQKTQPKSKKKTHANQLILGKFCSLPVDGAPPLLTLCIDMHKAHGFVCKHSYLEDGLDVGSLIGQLLVKQNQQI